MGCQKTVGERLSVSKKKENKGSHVGGNQPGKIMGQCPMTLPPPLSLSSLLSPLSSLSSVLSDILLLLSVNSSTLIVILCKVNSKCLYYSSTTIFMCLIWQRTFNILMERTIYGKFFKFLRIFMVTSTHIFSFFMNFEPLNPQKVA